MLEIHEPNEVLLTRNVDRPQNATQDNDDVRLTWHELAAIAGKPFGRLGHFETPGQPRKGHEVAMGGSFGRDLGYFEVIF